MTRFETIELAKWRQFDEVSIKFHERCTIITGANGAGKTTILNLLSRHFGWNLALAGTLRVTRTGARRYFSGVAGLADEEANQQRTIGTLKYDNGITAELQVPSEGEQFHVNIVNLQQVPGSYLTSHRPVYSFQKVTEIPTEVQAGEQLFEQYLQNIRQFYQPNARVQSASARLKSSLISLATFGYGNKVVEQNDAARETFEGFTTVLASVLPLDLGFRRLSVRMPEVILECDGGDFSLDAASGGISALIDVAWQIYMRSKTSPQFTVVLDEPENHLHPQLQRSLLPGLLKAFPEAQFIVATHNPFLVTSVRESNIVVLDFGDNGVRSTALPEADRSASANKVLSDVLGVPFPVPMWVEDEIDKIVTSIGDRELNAALLTEIKESLTTIGLGDLFPQVIDRLLPASEGR